MTVTLFTDDGGMVDATTYVRDGREWVRWLSDWSSWPTIDRLRPHHRGPDTHGHVDLEVIPWEEWDQMQRTTS